MEEGQRGKRLIILNLLGEQGTHLVATCNRLGALNLFADSDEAKKTTQYADMAKRGNVLVGYVQYTKKRRPADSE